MANSNGLSVNELRSKRDLRLLDTIDKLRSQGISQYVSLPQIIVCGDQSSGKSSVLEAISGVPFPSKSNLCTRFPTELILRKHDVEKIDVSIVAHPDSTAHEKTRLAGFAATLKDVNQLPALIERAKTTMGLDENSSAFSKHTLRVETSGPTLPHLTIVDLPGLIHSANKRQTGSDVAVIESVVERYMLEPRSIILAVISAKNDYANQIVLNMAREVDKNGTRTLGVITKPDTLHPKSESERTYINLARNKEVQFCHGWHVVKNLDSDKGVATRAERDAKEKEFFATGSWASLHSSIKGIETLRKRLSSVLYHQVSAELPKLLEEISNNKKTNEKKLAKLGEPRDTESKQRRYLTQCAAEFQSLITAALNGNYHDPFFEDRDGVKGYDKRIRSAVAGDLTVYSEFMAKHGRLHRVVSRPDRLKAVGSEILITEDDLLRNISQRMIESRGRELPGMVNTSVVSDLFRQESRLWENLTLIHIKALWAAVVEAIRHLAWHCADASTARSVFEIAIKPKLTKYRDNMEAEILESLKSHRDIHATTFNRYYTESLQNIRLERYTRQFTTVITQRFQEFENMTADRSEQAVAKLARTLATHQESSATNFTAAEALDMLNAYYRVVEKRFIDNIATKVVEGCFLEHLTEVFSPTVVAGMEQRLISRLASETQECIAAREELNQQIQIFASGEETCNKFIQMREPESDSDDDDDDAAFFDTNERTVKVENGSEGGLFEATPPPSAGRKRPENGPTGSTGSPSRKKRSRKT